VLELSSTFIHLVLSTCECCSNAISNSDGEIILYKRASKASTFDVTNLGYSVSYRTVTVSLNGAKAPNDDITVEFKYDADFINLLKQHVPG